MTALKKQARRVILPVDLLLQYLQRIAPQEFPNVLMREIHADVRTKQCILHLETNTDQVLDSAGHPVPMTRQVDWNKVFGKVPCEASGETTPVEELTVSRAAYEQYRTALEEAVGELCPETGWSQASHDPAVIEKVTRWRALLAKGVK
jgi:hypothetical protein